MEYQKSTTYAAEAVEAERRAEEARVAREGTEIWRARKEEDRLQKLRDQSELRRMLANYWPWGRPGGGAPCASALRKRNVPLEPSGEPSTSSSSTSLLPQAWGTRSMMDRLYNDRLEHNNLDYNSYDAYNRGAVAEPAWNARKMRAGAAGKAYRLGDDGIAAATAAGSGSTRHVPTDATRPGYMIDSWRVANSGSREYVAELSEQIRRKQERAMEERRRDGESSLRHLDTWRGLWGRPGHGAPIDHARRNNLHDILYRPPPVHFVH